MEQKVTTQTRSYLSFPLNQNKDWFSSKDLGSWESHLVHVWVQISNLFEEFWHESILEAINHSLGNLLKVQNLKDHEQKNNSIAKT